MLPRSIDYSCWRFDLNVCKSYCIVFGRSGSCGLSIWPPTILPKLTPDLALRHLFWDLWISPFKPTPAVLLAFSLPIPTAEKALLPTLSLTPCLLPSTSSVTSSIRSSASSSARYWPTKLTFFMHFKYGSGFYSSDRMCWMRLRCAAREMRMLGGGFGLRHSVSRVET